MVMGALYTVFLSGFDDIDHHVFRQSIEYHIKNTVITNDPKTSDVVLTMDMIGNPPYRIGALLDTIEKALFKNRFNNKIVYKQYTLNWSESELSIENKAIALSDRERDLMIELLNSGENGSKRDVLLNKIWGYKSNLETHALETQIYRLRQKIEDEPDTPKRLITIENGYKLI